MIKHSDIGKFISLLADDHDLPYIIGPDLKDYYILIQNLFDGRAVEIDYLPNDEDKITFFYFSDFGSASIVDCNELDLKDPESITKVEKWIKKLL